MLQSMREHSVEQHLKDEIEKHGGRCVKLNPAGYVGIPDRLILHPAWFGLAELKRPKGGRYSVKQDLWRDWLVAAGINYVRLKTKGEVDEFISANLAT